jgi:Zn-dependent protease with chaperone function
MRLILASTFALTLVFCGLVRAESGEAVSPTLPAAEAAAATAADEGPVAVPEPTEKAVRYHRSGVALWIFGTVWSVALPVFYLFTGLSARIRTLAQRIGRRWFFTIALYFVLLSLLDFAIGLPLEYYTGFMREHAYGLSNQTHAKWFHDEITGLLVGIVASVVFGWVPFLLLKKSPRRWWIYTGAFAVPLIFFVVLVEPVWVAPLFNKFGPMKDKGLESQILTLASRAGIEGSRVFEVDKSVDTKALNAYVTGLGQTKRIVLWDTIIARLSPRELLAVMGHEMGHYVLGHVWRFLVITCLVVWVGLYLAHRVTDALIERFRTRFGFDSLADVAAFPLLSLILGAAGFVLTPAVLAYSRHAEHEADRFSLELTHDNHAMATAFVKLQEDNLAIPRPHPILVFLRASHPTLGDRIDFANDYHPWRDRPQP